MPAKNIRKDRFTVRVSESEHDQFTEACQRRGASQSAVLRKLTAKYAEATLEELQMLGFI